MQVCRQAMIFGLVVAGYVIANPCSAQEPAGAPPTEELQREVADLRKAVAELTKRLEAMEYQQMPRMGAITPRLAAPRFLSPILAPPPPYLRFSVDIERAMLAPW